MKTFILALLALPAILAAPTSTASTATIFPFNSAECACVNAAGATRSSGLCHLQGGQLNGPEEWCHRAVSWAPELDTIFTDKGCAGQWGAEWNKGVCRTTALCQGLGGPDYYKLC